MRTERYHTWNAARRLLRYFKEKLELFGPEKLTSDITWDDIGEGARSYLELGGLQLLPDRDKAGRSVVFFCDAMSGNSEGIVMCVVSHSCVAG